jgi:peptidoglycan/xylan/chitin deacetylase (PgdA/CDA1 family)
MRLIRPFFFSDWLYPDAIFRIRTSDKLLWLTFDDGPDPLSTLHLLDIIGRHGIKAAFFCDGKAAHRYPELVSKIKSEGHIIGNHGYLHPDGWRTSLKDYVYDVDRAAIHTSASLFRPPYGHLRIAQYRALRKRYKIVFWDLMPYDFDKSLGTSGSLKILLGKMRAGSVIVLHDKPDSSVSASLNEFIITAYINGYKFIIPEISPGSC